ncbi:hypothetical protein ABZP36_016240 [Zizania latifolia]
MNDMESAENVLEELQKLNKVPWSLYTTMANSYIKRQQFDKAELTLKKESSHERYDMRIPNVIIQAYLDKAKELVNRFLKHFEDMKDADGMETFCECLRKLNCLDAEAYEALVRTYISAGKTNPSIA